MGKDLTGVRSPQRQLVPDTVGPEERKPTFLRGIANKAKAGMRRRFSFLGFEFYWMADRQGVPRVKRRTARKCLQAACRRIKEWIKCNRHLLGGEFFRRLNVRLRGHYNYYGVRGNSHSLYRFFNWAIECAFKWLNRRSWRRSYTWEQFNRVLELVPIARPRITEVKRRRVFA